MAKVYAIKDRPPNTYLPQLATTSAKTKTVAAAFPAPSSSPEGVRDA